MGFQEIFLDVYTLDITEWVTPHQSPEWPGELAGYDILTIAFKS